MFDITLFMRHVKRSQTSFLINLVGLSTGLTCVLLIFLWVDDELRMDKFHEKDKQLFQVMIQNKTVNGIDVSPVLPPILTETLLAEIPDIEDAVAEAVIPSSSALSLDEKSYNVYGYYVDPSYLKVFSYDLIAGDKNTVLADESSIVISEDVATSLFGPNENAIGKSLDFDHRDVFVVTGVYKIPAHSSKKFDFLIPYKALFKHFPNIKNDWSNRMPNTYIVLKPGVNVDGFNNKMNSVVAKHWDQEGIELFATPFSKTYLYGRYENGIQAGGRIEYVKLFSIIAVAILIIACINFMNLSTAKASTRMKEVGIKKTLGIQRRSLISQYLGESVMMALLSLIVALVLVVLLLPEFNALAGKHIGLDFRMDLLVGILGITILTGLVAGSYPAFYLSGFNPVQIFKKKLATSLGEIWVRKGLIVFQYVLSTMFIIAALVVYKQMELIQNRNLGYSKDNVVYFEINEDVKKNLETFLTEIKKISGVKNASSIFRTFLGNLNSTADVVWEGKDPNQIVDVQYRRVNYDLIEVLGIEVKEGKSFSREIQSEIRQVIFNEAAIKMIGYTDPIGRRVKLWGDEYEIIGVTKDFYFESIHENVKPIFFCLRPERTNTVMVKVDSQNLMSTVEGIQSFYKEYTNGQPLEYKFLNEIFQAQYVSEKQVSVLSKYFAGLAIIISSLGLFGLTAFLVERRIKEIGIRKTLGANDFNITYILSKDLNVLVLISFVIALPISYVLAAQWLNTFSLHIDIKAWYFIAACFVTTFLTWLVVWSQTVKAARMNIVKSLRRDD